MNTRKRNDRTTNLIRHSKRRQSALTGLSLERSNTSKNGRDRQYRFPTHLVHKNVEVELTDGVKEPHLLTFGAQVFSRQTRGPVSRGQQSLESITAVKCRVAEPRRPR